MSKSLRIRTKEERSARQLKLCSIVLIVYLVAIILYILAIKDSKQRNATRFGNDIAKKKILILPQFNNF